MHCHVHYDDDNDDNDNDNDNDNDDYDDIGQNYEDIGPGMVTILVHPCHHDDHLQAEQVGVETAELPSDPKPPYISPGGCYISPP